MESIIAKVKDIEWWQLYEQFLELLKERNTQYALVGGVIVAYAARKVLWGSKYKMPPGPRGLPVVGNTISCRNMELIHTNFAKWRKQYGDVFTIHIGPQAFVILASSPAIREAFITKGNDFAGRMTTQSLALFTDEFKDIALAQPGPVWKLQRQIAHSALRKYASGHLLEDNLESCMDSLVAYMDEQPDKIVDIPDIMLKLTYNFLATVCYGRQFGMDDPWLNNFMKMIRDLNEKIGSGFISDFFPFLAILDRTKFKYIEETMKSFYELVDGELEEHKKTFDANAPRDFIDELLLQLKKQEESGESNSVLKQLTKSHLIQTLSDIFFAGTDTSRITLSMVIAYMAEYPEIQAKLHRELDDVLGENGKVTLKMKEQLPYTNAVVHETMRYNSVVPLGVPHKTTCDTSLGEFTIPKDTNVIQYTHGVHHDPANFSDPKKFKPERWIDANGKFQYQPYIFMPFSMGPRVCVGETLARADLQLFSAMLFHKYEFTPVEADFKLETVEIQFSVEVKPYKLKLIARQ